MLLRFDSDDHGGGGGGGDGRNVDVRALAADSQHLAMAMSADSHEARHVIGRLAPHHSSAVTSIHETLLGITRKLDAVRTRREEFLALTKVCTFLAAASALVVSRNSSSSSSSSKNESLREKASNLGALESCVEDLELLVERWGKRRKPLLRRSNSMVKLTSDINDIYTRVAEVARSTGLAGVLAVFKGVLENTGGENGSHKGGCGGGNGSSGPDQDELLTHHEVKLARHPVEKARAPSLAPPRQSWHVKRERVISTVLEALLSTEGSEGRGAGIDGGPGEDSAGPSTRRPRVVGLVGDSGAGKTTVAAEICCNPDALEYFSDGVFWLPVKEGDGSRERLPFLMRQLAGMVHKVIGGSSSDGSIGTSAEDYTAADDESDSAEAIAASIRGAVECCTVLNGLRHQRRQRRCLVVADNVWEKEVIAMLRETGMSILLTSCKLEMVQESGGSPVVIGRLVEVDAVRVLRKAAELPSDEPLPAGAKDLAEMCGRVALDLSSVGRWSNVCGSKDPMAWQHAANNIRSDLQKLELAQEDGASCGMITSKAQVESGDGAWGDIKLQLQQSAAPHSSTNDDSSHVASLSSSDAAVTTFGSSTSSTSSRTQESRENRRKVVLRAGYRDLIGTAGDKKLPHNLYVALAVLPDDHEFTAQDAAVLLHESYHRKDPGVLGKEEVTEEEKTAEKALKMLEARGILVPVGVWERGTGCKRRITYRLHRAHSGFVREILLECHEILESALRRWVCFISSLDAALFFGPVVLGRLWEAVELVGGRGWRKSRPYETALGKIDEGDPLYGACLVAVAKFREKEGDWGGASLMWRRLLAVEQQATEPNAMYPLWRLMNAAEKNGSPEEARSWRQAGSEALLRAMCESAQYSVCSSGIGGSGSGSPSDSTESTSAMQVLSLNLERFGPFQGMQSQLMLRRALEIQESALGPDDILVASTLRHLGVCIRQAGKLKEAEKLLKRALEIEEAALGEDDVRAARTAFDLAVCLRLAGKFQDAEVLLRRVAKIETAERGGDGNLQTARVLHEQGVCARLCKQGRQEEAAGMFARALAIREDKLRPDDPSVGQTLYELGMCSRQEGRQHEAEAFFRRALEIKRAAALRMEGKGGVAPAGTGVRKTSSKRSDCNHDRSEVSVALATFQLGVCILQGGQRLDEAEGMLRSVLGMEEERLGPNHVTVARIAFQLGVCLWRAGRLKEAESVLSGCVKTLERKLGSEHQEVTAANEVLDTWPSE